MKQCIMIPKEERKILVREKHNKGATKKEKRKIFKVAALGDHELIVCEILSRLPAKSLAKFKCVCKNWQSLIQRDQLFIDLHFNRSQTRSCSGTVGATSLLIWDTTERNEQRCLLSAELLLPYDSSGGGGGAAVQTEIPLNIGDNPVSRGSMLNIVNGLICLIDRDSHSTCVFNPSTRESTPWIKSMVVQKQEEKGGIIKHDSNKFRNFLWDKFGYDVATGDYKVVSFWSRIVGPTETEWVCEIFSLRDKSWRLIDAVPPVHPFCLASFVYANGSIYWFCDSATPSIVELNFVTEKFRQISVSSPVMTGFCNQYRTALVEVDGRLALFTKDARPSYNYISRKKEHEDDVKMYILYDDQDKTNYHWMPAKSFAEPPFEWKQDMFARRDFIIPIPGTDVFIVRPDDDFSFYYYNWKKKSYSRKFELNGAKSFFNKKPNNEERDHISFSTFAENLMPLN
ncbi:putative F-box protein At2g02030 [Papaver somniferum]|uniref:putative F-box protein At2g02030 n=1 Tax=Papaver somniferum TaxID=3469 RepID=UPI000E70386C|nr:putative F-box protein At2g02030 [Papaver somniferum]